MKVGLCGLGDRLSYVAKVMSEQIPNFELVCFADPSSIKNEYMLSQGINMKQYDELSDMLANETVDFLMIGSPNHLHLDHIRIGLEHGVKIFTEKPVVISEDETFNLLDLIKKHDAVDNILVGMVLRYSPLYKDLKSTIDAGLLGEISSIEASEHIAPEHGAFFMRDWRRKPEYSGGFMLEKCCHDLDIYQGALGSRASQVVSFGGRRTFIAKNKALASNAIYSERKSRWQGDDVVFTDEGKLVDHQTALIQYENGVSLSFHTNLNVPDEYRRFSAFGSLGMAEGDFVRSFYKVHDAVTSELLIDKSYQHDESISKHYGAEEQMATDWIAYFNEGTPLPVSILDALESGLTALKLDESREKGTVLDLTALWQRFDSYQLR